MNKNLTVVTGNSKKLREIQSAFEDIDLEITNEKLDLVEIQSLDIEEICEYKVKEAYKILKKPVMVEDTSATIDELNGLPGPFIKFFQEKLGSEALIILANSCTSRSATVINNVAYYDGEHLIQAQGITQGSISKELASGVGFGFDYCFIPNGFDKTFAELGEEVKKEHYGRKKAIIKLKEKLQKKKINLSKKL